MDQDPSAAQGHPPPHHGHCHGPIYTDPPPSYEDATHSSTSPLLVGSPPDYGAFRAYVDPYESSEASTEGDDNAQYLSERIGQAFAFVILLGILYLFWSIVTQPDPDNLLHVYV
ncbi:uncharacterized protein M421DRAFT_4924 [Didymella exigua CBS 183.55]|uniref:Uncharacterized protein n=1 Tax=Didymella exigua CBS 183.55 TaxID=1150837 RepID=A0A6A5RP76_9PLEO|nr:uncharacterized protein M421DRAFT_4924 [Didymella exigua CBS 183.55]KAF1929120.1 hypothetical protein M421DRAFT_4924 [Didymella exigua CBS 183.55]